MYKRTQSLGARTTSTSKAQSTSAGTRNYLFPFLSSTLLYFWSAAWRAAGRAAGKQRFYFFVFWTSSSTPWFGAELGISLSLPRRGGCQCFLTLASPSTLQSRKRHSNFETHRERERRDRTITAGHLSEDGGRREMDRLGFGVWLGRSPPSPPSILARACLLHCTVL